MSELRECGEGMSMFSSQIKELRKMADSMGERGREIGLDYGMGRGLADASRILREAADTIESPQELQGVASESRYTELFGTPERAARTICRQLKHFNICICDGCPVKPPNKECDSEYDALLEWLKGDEE